MAHGAFTLSWCMQNCTGAKEHSIGWSNHQESEFLDPVDFGSVAFCSGNCHMRAKEHTIGWSSRAISLKSDCYLMDYPQSLKSRHLRNCTRAKTHSIKSTSLLRLSRTADNWESLHEQRTIASSVLAAANTLASFLKNRLATQWTILNGYSANFWEIAQANWAAGWLFVNVYVSVRGRTTGGESTGRKSHRVRLFQKFSQSETFYLPTSQFALEWGRTSVMLSIAYRKLTLLVNQLYTMWDFLPPTESVCSWVR